MVYIILNQILLAVFLYSVLQIETFLNSFLF